MGWWVARLLAATLLLAPGYASAQATQPSPEGTATPTERVGLVIGNGAYRYLQPTLPNPANDARAIGATLKRLGFSVEVGIDLDRLALEEALAGFGARAEAAEVAVVFYAGHGIQVDGENYLLPVDANIKHKRDLRRLLPLGAVLDEADEARRLTVVMLDACRDNPFLEELARSLGGPSRSAASLGRGLAIPDAPADTLVAYATRAEAVALDGDGEHSPFTTALLQHMPTPGLELRLLFGKVRDSVRAATGNKQEPFTYGSLGATEFHFAPALAEPAAPGSDPVELARFNAAVSIREPRLRRRALEDFLARHPAGALAPTAALLLEELKLPVENAPTTPVLGPPEQPVALTPTPAMVDTPAAIGETACDRLAGDPDDPQHVGPGVRAEKDISTARAIPACREAVRQHPNVARFRYQLARALQGDSEAVGLFRALVVRDHAPALRNLARMHATGRGVPRDEPEAARLLRRAVTLGDAVAQHQLGLMHLRGGSPGVARDEAEAARLLRKAAEQGVAEAQNQLGLMNDTGVGVARDDAEAVHWYRLAAEQGFAAAQRNLASMYADGDGIARDDTEAVRWYRKAAEQGDASAQDHRGAMYLKGRGVARGDPEVVRWIQEKGSASDQFELGLMYAVGRGVARNDAQAVGLFRSAAAQGDAAAQYNLGRMYEDGRGVARAHAEAMGWYRTAAARGNADAQNNLASMYEDGRLLPKDYAQAVHWYRKAAEQGDAVAQYNLGRVYENGRGVPRDDAEAARWYRKAVRQGDAAAQNELGRMHELGRGVPRDYLEAVRLYRMAATQGDPAGQTSLGVMYDEGKGVARNDDEAVRWYRMAAAAGDARAQNNLGYMHANGEGVAQDDAEAVRWYARAIASGESRVAASNLQGLGRRAHVRAAQVFLGEPGHKAGRPDGTMGSQTRLAIRAFQRAEGLPVTGELSTDLLVALAEKKPFINK